MSLSATRNHNNQTGEKSNASSSKANEAPFFNFEDNFFRPAIYTQPSLMGNMVGDNRGQADIGRRRMEHISPRTILSDIYSVPTNTVQLDRNAEREWFDEHPEPRASESGRRLILWNFPIDSSDLHAGHQAATERFLQRNILTFLSRGTEIEVIGHASESGTPEHNDALSNDRASRVATFVRTLRPQNRIISYGLGQVRPIASGASPEDMARNRSVEIVILVPQRREVPHRVDRWQQAREYLEERLGGATLGADADQLWTPTITCVTRMIPVVPTPFGNPNPNAGTAVPNGPLCLDRPASSCMPRPHRVTIRILGQMLERRFRLETMLSEEMVRAVTDDFIHQCRQAKNRRDELLMRLNLGASQGGGRMVQRDREAYLNAERVYFEGDPTCIWRYV